MEKGYPDQEESHINDDSLVIPTEQEKKHAASPQSTEEDRRLARQSAHPLHVGPLKAGSFFDLFHYFTASERLLAVAAALLSGVAGFGLPAFSIFFGKMSEALGMQYSKQESEAILREQFVYMSVVALVVLLLGGLGAFCWDYLARTQAVRLRSLYFGSLLRQDAAWLDSAQAAQATTGFDSQVTTLASVFSNKMSLFAMNLCSVLGGVILAFVKGWVLACFLLLLAPFVLAAAVVYVHVTLKADLADSEGTEEASGVARQCFGLIRTVKALCAEEREAERFARSVEGAKRVSARLEWCGSLSWAVAWGGVLLSYMLSFLIGSRLVINKWRNSNSGELYSPSDVVAILWFVIVVVMNVGQLGALLRSLSRARVAVARIRRVTDGRAELRGDFRPDRLKGQLVFENVSFAYPHRPDALVLDRVNIRVEPGQKAAVLGLSGAGKSTLLALLQRHYDPTGGRILLDGVDLRQFDLTHLRARVGLLDSDPAVLADSLRFNLTVGSQVPESDDPAIMRALELADAADLVESLPQGLDQQLGPSGSLLSAGQRRQLNLARTLLKRPDVFLVDDTLSVFGGSSGTVHKRLRQVVEGRTALTAEDCVAAVAGSDVVFVLQNGRVVQAGSPRALQNAKEGLYAALLRAQSQSDEQLGRRPTEEVLSTRALRESQSAASLQASRRPAPPQDAQAAGPLVQTRTAPARVHSVASLLGPEKWHLPLALLAALLHGAALAFFGLVLGRITKELLTLDCVGAIKALFSFLASLICAFTSTSGAIASINQLIGGFAGVAVAALLCSFLQSALFGLVGREFSAGLRKAYFRRLLFQDAAFFDVPRNSPALLAARLSLQGQQAKDFVGVRLGSVAQAVCCMVVALVIGLVVAWRVALVALACTLLVFVCPLLESLAWHWGRGGRTRDDGSQLLSDAVDNMRAVRALAADRQLLQRFQLRNGDSRTRTVAAAACWGATRGLSLFLMFMAYAVLVRVSLRLVVDGTIQSTDFVYSIFTLLLGLFGLGQAAMFVVDCRQEGSSPAAMMDDLNSPSLIEADPADDSARPGRTGTLKKRITGVVEFDQVVFKYPGRDRPVLKGLSLRVDSGQRGAVVGGSGSGKSTLARLLLRFYDPTEGCIRLDGVVIRDYDLRHLRRSIGAVLGEEGLFGGSVSSNVWLGWGEGDKDSARSSPDVPAIEALLGSVADDFDRDVGFKGRRLSADERRRVALARAVVRSPKVYVTDDSASPAETLLNAQATRVSLASRLSSIGWADVVFVLEDGRIVESGTHDEFTNRGGAEGQFARR